MATAALAQPPKITESSSPPPIDSTLPTPSSSPSSSSSSSVHETTSSKLSIASRPKAGSRKISGSIIVSRDCPTVELKDEVFHEDDARTMSPRRNSEDLEQMGRDARTLLSQHAKQLHESLLTIFNRIEAVKEEHDKLDSHNKFLQQYIGDLMSTSKITASGGGGSAVGRGKK